MDQVLSVIIPVYNGERFLPDMLALLASQARSEVEFVFVDDCSTDSTAQLLDDFAHDESVDSAVTVLTQPERSGPGQARRTGLAAAQGDHVVCIDVDDQPHSRAISLILDAIKRYGDTTVLVFDFAFRWTSGRRQVMAGMRHDHLSGSTTAVNALLRGDITPYMWNKVFPRQGLDPLHFSDAWHSEDWLTLPMVFASHPELQRVPIQLVDYCQWPGSLSRQTNLLHYTSADAGLPPQVRTMLEEAGMWEACRESFEQWFAPRVIGNAAVAAAGRTGRAARDELRAIRDNTRESIPIRTLLSAIGKGDRVAAGSLLLLRTSMPIFHIVAGSGRFRRTSEQRVDATGAGALGPRTTDAQGPADALRT